MTAASTASLPRLVAVRPAAARRDDDARAAWAWFRSFRAARPAPVAPDELASARALAQVFRNGGLLG